MDVQHLVWLIILSSILVNGEVVYLSQKHNDSIELPCVSKDSSPYGFYLKRKWLQPNKEVLFIHEDFKAKFADGINESRFRVVEGLRSGQVNVTISHLQGSDTDLYVCDFVFAGDYMDRKEPGRNEFLLYVVDHVEQPCTCSRYPVLLYSIAGAVGLLLLLIFVGLSVAYCGKARNGKKPQLTVPVYEEMTGLQSRNKKGFCDQAGFGDSVYMQPRRENPYSNP